MKKVLILTAAMLFCANLFCDKSPLLLACERDDLNAVKAVLEKSAADVNKTDEKGSAPLHIACTKKNIEIVRLLLDKGADANKKDGSGCTPQFLALPRGDILNLLLKKGAKRENRFEEYYHQTGEIIL